MNPAAKPRPARETRTMRRSAEFLARTRPFLVGLPAAGLLVGLLAGVVGFGELAGPIWVAATTPVIVALAVEIVDSLGRREIGLDIIALLSMGGALLLGEALAGAVVALMYAGGQFLESYAARRPAVT